MQPLTVTLTRVRLAKDGEPNYYEVKRGRTWLALVTFDGPRGAMVTHQGTLYADERKDVYHAYALIRGRD